eukprot:TRINITY_DN16344_c0_g1_i1.p1 TRINITY_DN16344_c0_g1~~TRINITY_DN16344_c0_g1_i1.p1  ORF type:complete len:255 (-),score=44.11 TRINITY_DN16344_c0_g1_i1:13-777(-)
MEDDDTSLSPAALAALNAFLADTTLQAQAKEQIESFRSQPRVSHEGEVDNTEYSKPEYWEKRYVKESAQQGFRYDWLAPFRLLKPVLESNLPDKKAKILLVGCGNSTLSEDMAQLGYTALISTDISPTVIASMKKQWIERSGANQSSITWEVQDYKKLSYPDKSFDVVLDKATLDAFLAEECDMLSNASVRCSLSESYRVLRPGGVFVWVTFGVPKGELLTLRGAPWASWQTRCFTVGDGEGALQYDIWVAKKQ